MTQAEFINKLLAQFTMLLSLSLEGDQGTGLYDLLVVLCRDETAKHEITIRFKNVANLNLEVDAGGWVQFMMLRVAMNDDGNERRFKVEEREHGVLRFTCSAIETN